MLSSARRKNKDVSAFPQIAAKVCEVSNFSRLLPFPFPRQEKNVPFLNQHPPARARSQDGGGGGEGPLISVSKLFFFSLSATPSSCSLSLSPSLLCACLVCVGKTVSLSVRAEFHGRDIGFSGKAYIFFLLFLGKDTSECAILSKRLKFDSKSIGELYEIRTKRRSACSCRYRGRDAKCRKYCAPSSKEI